MVARISVASSTGNTFETISPACQIPMRSGDSTFVYGDPTFGYQDEAHQRNHRQWIYLSATLKYGALLVSDLEQSAT
jgi:hypothetical protein